MKILKREVERGYLLVIGILIILLLIGYYSYALFTLETQEKKSISIQTGNLYATLSSTDSAFQNNQITVNANETKTLMITLTNSNQRNAKFNFYYVNTIPAGVTVMYLEDTPNIPIGEDGRVINKGSSENYSIEISNTTGSSVTVTFGSNAGLENKDLTFPSNGKVLEEKPVDPVPDDSGASAPTLGNLIPVVFDEQSKVWKKADITKAKEWYDYENQRWANAVVVSPEKYNSTYESAAAGTEVKMDDILQMYVWIPRYSYAIQGSYGKKEDGRSDTPTQSSPGEIDVKFIEAPVKNTGDGKYDSGSPTDSDWYTPDAFTLGGQELSGLWVGKFEAGYSGASSSSNAEKNTNNESSKVIIKPNVYSWRNITVSNIYKTVKGITGATSTFGLSSETYDSHAMKNSEWGAVAYLTQSKYGKYGNSKYTGANKEVYINNYYSSSSERYKTGCSGMAPGASTSSTCTAYDDLTDQGNGKGLKGPGASTTGNVYGIYDMSGGAYEYVMGNLNKATGSSGFTSSDKWTTDDAKYFNFYTSTSSTSNEYKSHAIGETENWYGDNDNLVTRSYPWFFRGGMYDDTSYAGVFYYYYNDGNYSGYNSFRVVLTLKETA